MQKYSCENQQKTAWEKNVFFVAITALLILFGVGSTSYASIAIHGARATAGYWTVRNPDGDKLCLTQEEIASVNQAIREETSSLTDLITYPQEVDSVTLKELILSAQQDFRGEVDPGEHYDKGGRPISQADYQMAQDNCNLDTVPTSVNVRYGVVTMRTDMRLLPTARYYFDDKSFQHYDDLQGTALDPCEPLLVLHMSKDGAYAFAIGRYYMGWVSLGAIGFTEREKWEEYVSPQNFLVVTDHKKKVRVSGAWDVLFQMGSIIPLKSSVPHGGVYQAVIPVEINGHLSEVETSIKSDSTVNLGYLPCTPNNFVRQSLKFLDDVYGWGGMEESVDCSSFVQDVYRSMGILLPRDAEQQELAMIHSLSLEGLDTAARYQKAAEAPAGALFFKPGHVMLYLGKDDKGTPLAIHSASSYFTFSGSKGKKHYIRKVLISDLTYQNGKAVRTIDGMTSIGSCF